MDVVAGLEVDADDYVISLASTELRLLLELSGTPGRVHSRQQLLESVWEHGYFGDSRLVDACVQQLRAKIEKDSTAPVYVQTVRGFGYRFRFDVTASSRPARWFARLGGPSLVRPAPVTRRHLEAVHP